MINRYKILISGKNPDYFLKKLLRKNISIYDLEKTKDGIKIVITKEDYDKIKEIKTIYKIKVIGRYGIAKFKNLLNKYMIFIISLIIGFLLITTLSKMIFKIEVIHTDENIRNIIIKDLEEKGIKKFNFKVSYKEKEKIKQYILNKETDDIEWLEIEEKGTKYIVRVQQRKKNKEEDTCTAQNIVAKKDAMILSIEASAGEIVKKKLDYVKKGDIIISGLIYNKETITNKKCATGKVFGEVWYKVTLELPKNYREENVTGKEKTQLELIWLNNNYTLFSNYKTYKKKTTSIIKSAILPFSINITKYLETKVIEENYDLENIDKKALSIATKKLNTKLGEEDTIISKKVLKKYEKNSKIVVEVFFKVKEDITDTESIEDINIEEENNKITKE